MPSLDCTEWEYNRIPGYQGVLSRAIAAVLVRLRSGGIDTLSNSKDTRPIHAELFGALAQPPHQDFAGHYRGERFRCLEDYAVQVQGDPRVGTPPQLVAGGMGDLAKRVGEGLSALDAASRLPKGQLPDEQRVLFVVAFACQVFEVFLRIHPYANGNGHLGRFLIWAILGRYGYWPRKWTIEPRPSDPPYSQMIVSYRDGDREPLERHVLWCLA